MTKTTHIEGRTGRKIAERIKITGTLVLQTPTHLGNGDTDALTDMPLILDEVTQKPLLTGTSIAGALRAYLRELEHGYNGRETINDRSFTLFGAVNGNESVQSLVILDDALGESPGRELRDGVKICPKTRTAVDRHKYDIELLQAGTTFEISVELLIPEGDQPDKLLESMAMALQGLQKGEIGLGKRKHRGFGQLKLTEWRILHFKLTNREGLLSWLQDNQKNSISGPDIWPLLQTENRAIDKREQFCLSATFYITSPLLIKTGGQKSNEPDVVHLHSYRQGHLQPVISGTSLAGAIRARAFRIAKTVAPLKAQVIIDEMFGKDKTGSKTLPTASRVITHETTINNTMAMVQNRIKIDRFTSGPYPKALYSEQPVLPLAESQSCINVELRQPKSQEIGLLLLVLKDLWSNDLPLGGESSIGRGKLKGKSAVLRLKKMEQDIIWNFQENSDGTISFSGNGNSQSLEDYVSAFIEFGRKS
jgi:CRISPR/Cas system CSM-associated protein Csm3 (group 7 of RAMP superfamily)